MTRVSVVSIELLLDEVSETFVRAEWQALAAAGLSSMAAHTAPSNRPHVTLLVREQLAVLDPTALAERPAFEVRLGAPLLFGSGDRRVLVRSVIPSAELLALHDDVHRSAGPGDDAPHTLPGAWTPHVTLARRVRLQDLERALRSSAARSPARRGRCADGMPPRAPSPSSPDWADRAARPRRASLLCLPRAFGRTGL